MTHKSILAPLAILEKKIPLNPINQSETYTHTVKENTHIHMQRHSSTFSQPHTLPPRLWDALFSHRHADLFLARLFTQPSSWYSATSCSVAVHLFIPLFSIYQQAAAISKPPAPILSSQNKGEHLTAREETTTHTKINMGSAYVLLYQWQIHKQL